MLLGVQMDAINDDLANMYDKTRRTFFVKVGSGWLP